MNQNERKGPKDCRLCDRRRVKCDRSLPTCTKCAKKGLECTGYGLILQWGQGVASRGNLAGKSIPVLPRRKKSRGLAKATRPVGEDVEDPRITGPVFSVPSRPDSISTENRVVLSESACRGLAPHNEFALGQTLSSFSSLLLEHPTIRFFLHHYDQTLAANMAWTDCDDNPWRSIMMPMAMHSPPLMFSILAFAAKHMSAMATSASALEVAVEAARYSKRFGRRALELLAQELRPSSDDVVSPRMIRGHQRNSSDSVLAAMLVLCNVETVWPDSSVWRVHLNAARTVLDARSEQEPLANTSVSSFLNQELFVASTFASITSFSHSVEIDPLAQEPGGVFVEFLKLLQKVTRLERHAFSHSVGLNTSNITPIDLEILFESARALTMNMSSNFKFSPRDGALQFNRIVNSFYHAGLIYSYRALFSFSSPEEEIHTSTELDVSAQVTRSRIELFNILDSMEMDTPTYAQDLVFPLFIAGTEASEPKEQDMVVRKLRQAMRGTGFSNCEQAVEFLTALWACRVNNPTETGGLYMSDRLNWIGFAREWSNQGRVFLVF